MNKKELRNAFDLSTFMSIKVNSYFPIYESLLCYLKGGHFTLVEVGVLNGGSLFMWRDYFGDNVRIIGIDLNPGAKHFEKYGFEIFIGD